MNKLINTLNTKENAHVLKALASTKISQARKELMITQALTKVKVANARAEAVEFMAWYKEVSK